MGGGFRSLAGERGDSTSSMVWPRKKVCSSVTLNYASKLNGRMWLVVTVLDRDRILQAVQKISAGQHPGINSV